MLLGPVFPAELVTSARRARYFVVRFVYGVLLLVSLWFAYASTSGFRNEQLSIQQAAQLASGFFMSFAWMQIGAVLLVAPALAAGAIAVERERRTIEYLFASDLSNFEVVWGKLGSRLVHIVCLVLVGLPVLALFRLLGGIPLELLLAVFSLTVCTMVTITIVSVALSVYSSRARDAVHRAYLVLAALVLLPLMFQAWFAAIQMPGWVGNANRQLLAANPVWVLFGLTQSQFGAARSVDWVAIGDLVVRQTGLSAICLAVATLSVRRVHLRAAGKGDRPSKRTRTRWTLRPRLGDSPMVWKELFAPQATSRVGIAGRIAAGLLVVSVLGATGWTFLKAWPKANWGGWQSGYDDYLAYAATMTTIVGAAGLLLVGARAAGSITGEKERDCWTSLLVTPLTGRQIVLAKVAGNLYAARWAVALLALISGLAILFRPLHVVSVAALGLALLATGLFASGLGVLFSLRSDTTLRAMGATLGTMLFVGGGYMCCCVPALIGTRNEQGIELMLAPFVPALLALPNFAAQLFGESANPGPESSRMVAAWVMGVTGYSVAALVLVGTTIEVFDRLSGRVVPRNALERLKPGQEDSPVKAEVVEEDPKGPADTETGG